ncbi:MAG: hypothetical protein ABIE70_11845 [bacterium]
MTDLFLTFGFLVFHLVNVLPGIAAATALSKRGWLAGPGNTLVTGYALGYAWEILTGILFMSREIPVWSLPIVSVLLALLIWRTNRENQDRSSLGLAFLSDHKWVWLLAGIAIALTMLVILRVGRVDGEYHVFTTLFVNDYFNHMAVTAELAKNVPPTNIYYHGPTAHYYWFFHSVPAMFHRLVGLQTNIRHLLLTIDMVNIVAFFLALSVVLKESGVSRRGAIVALCLVLIGYSYIDVFVLGREFGNLIGITRLLPALVPVWAKLEGFSGLSHSYIRDFWVEPHGVASMVFVFAATALYLSKTKKMPGLAKGLMVGSFVLCAFGCDSFLGFILALWIGTMTAIKLAHAKFSDRGQWQFVGGIGVIAVLGIGYVLGFNMIGGQSGMLSLAPLVGVMATLPFYLTLDYGPIFLLGLLGWVLLWRRETGEAAHEYRLLWIMALIALGLGLLLRHEIEYDILLRKSGKPLQLVLLVGAGWAIDWMFQHRRKLLKYAVIAILVALPTLALDVQAFGGFFGSRGLENRIAHADMVALEWIKNNTPPIAVVQGMPGYHGEYLYDINPIPAIAERPVYVGTYMLAALWGVGGEAALARTREVDTWFSAPSGESPGVSDRVIYLYGGTKELEFYGVASVRSLAGRENYFLVYDSLGVQICRRGVGQVSRGVSMPEEAEDGL